MSPPFVAVARAAWRAGDSAAEASLIRSIEKAFPTAVLFTETPADGEADSLDVLGPALARHIGPPRRGRWFVVNDLDDALLRLRPSEPPSFYVVAHGPHDWRPGAQAAIEAFWSDVAESAEAERLARDAALVAEANAIDPSGKRPDRWSLALAAVDAPKSEIIAATTVGVVSYRRATIARALDVIGKRYRIADLADQLS